MQLLLKWKSGKPAPYSYADFSKDYKHWMSKVLSVEEKSAISAQGLYLGVHGTRCTLMNYLLDNGYPADAVFEYIGWKSAKVAFRYRRTSPTASLSSAVPDAFTVQLQRLQQFALNQ
jgi:hypothetical protein